MIMSRAWAMPSRNTFSIPPIAALVRKYLYGISVDPFARNNRLATFTNDLNPHTQADHHLDAVDFLTLLDKQGVRADCVLLDPPYSPRQISECYAAAGIKATQTDTQNAALYRRTRDAVRRICRPCGIVLSFGWNSAGMGKGFDVVELLLVAHGGAHNDTICMVERMLDSCDGSHT
jgi:hypothetical protein